MTCDPTHHTARFDTRGGSRSRRTRQFATNEGCGSWRHSLLSQTVRRLPIGMLYNAPAAPQLLSFLPSKCHKRYNHAVMNRAHQTIWLRILGVFYIGLVLGGLSLHFWTVKMVLHAEGHGSAIVALVIPVGAEIYWATKLWRSLGFANLYTFAVIGYGVLWPLMAWALTSLEKTRDPDNLEDASELVAEILLRPHSCGPDCPCLQLRKVATINEAIHNLHLRKLQSKPRNT